MYLIAAIVLAIAVSAGSGALVGYQWGSSGCAKIAAKRAVVAEQVKSAVAVNDQKAKSALAQDDVARTAHFSGVRRDLNAQMDAKPELAARECLDADVLRIVNAGRAGAVPAVGPEPDEVVRPAAGDPRQ